MRANKKLMKYIKMKGWTSAHFQELVGITPRIFGYWRTCQRPIASKYWKKIIKVTDGYLSAEDFL